MLVRSRSSACGLLSVGARFVRTKAATSKSSPAAPDSNSPAFPGAMKAQYTNKMEFVSDFGTFPCYRVMDDNGKIVNDDDDPKLSKEQLLRMYEIMTTTKQMDTIMYGAQRQGRISFYMTAFGEEATHVGSAAALSPDDMIFAQYREAGVLMYRGFTLDDVMNQCFSNEKDLGKGRQMPVHYGSKALNFQTISSPLSTQIPQAAGAAYAFKRAGGDRIVACYFGDGAASEGDFHAALNFAATLESPVLFFCRNNGYAISTPTHEQYRGDGIVVRGPAYGIPSLRVDGNDMLAVYNAVKRGRDLARSRPGPVLIEAMTYRGGHHSTSDDASRYRTTTETKAWDKMSPLERTRKYLSEKGWWTSTQEEELQDKTRNAVIAALEKAQTLKKPHQSLLFTDVYQDKTQILEEQEKELLEHIAKYKSEYPVGEFAASP